MKLLNQGLNFNYYTKKCLTLNSIINTILKLIPWPWASHFSALGLRFLNSKTTRLSEFRKVSQLLLSCEFHSGLLPTARRLGPITDLYPIFPPRSGLASQAASGRPKKNPRSKATGSSPSQTSRKALDTCNTSRENWASCPAQSAEVQAGASPLTCGATWESWALETWALKTLSNSLPWQAPQFLGPGTSVAHTQTSRVLTGFLRACASLGWPLCVLSPHCGFRATRR